MEPVPERSSVEYLVSATVQKKKKTVTFYHQEPIREVGLPVAIVPSLAIYVQFISKHSE